MATEEFQKRLNQMAEKALIDLRNDLSKADHPITKLATIARYEGYGIALQELGADTVKLGKLVESEANKIEPTIRPFFK